MKHSERLQKMTNDLREKEENLIKEALGIINELKPKIKDQKEFFNITQNLYYDDISDLIAQITIAEIMVERESQH